MEVCFVQLVIVVVMGVICAAVASSKGRSVPAWFFAGFFGGIIGIIIVCCMSNLKEEQAHRQFVEMEQRRLREQLRQEQLKVEALRQYSQARLDAHDNALGMDTRPLAALPSLQPQMPALSAGNDPAQLQGNPGDPNSLANLATTGPQLAKPVQLTGLEPSPTQWYYEFEGTTVGPVSESTIHILLKSGRISGATLLWCQEFAEWTAASAIHIFQPSVNS